MRSEKEIQKARLLVQYFEHHKPVDKSEVLVDPIKTYDLVLGLPWFEPRNLEIDRTKGRLTALQMPNGPQRTKIPKAERASHLPEHSEENTNDEPSPDI